MKLAHLLIVLVLVFGICGCTNGTQQSETQDCYGLYTFTIPDTKIIPLSSDPSHKSTLTFSLINTRGTNVTVWSILFKHPNQNSILLGEGGIPQLYVWNCSSGSCTLVSTTFPFKMAPGQMLIVNGTISIPSDNLDAYETIFMYDTKSSTINHTETIQTKCLKGN